MRYVIVAAAFGLSAALAASWPGSSQAADPVHPTVIELFQSQGCSSCPPANANVMALSGRADLLSLSFGVTYWDYLGWRDTFAQPQFTQRQRDYARALGHDNVFTPQVVINGRVDGVGADPRELNALIKTGDRGVSGPGLAIRGGGVEVGAAAAPAGGADVWLVRYDPRIIQVAVQRGENGGRTLPHRNVVRALVKLGRWSGAATRLPLPAPGDPALATAVLVQTRGGGPILAAARG